MTVRFRCYFAHSAEQKGEVSFSCLFILYGAAPAHYLYSRKQQTPRRPPLPVDKATWYLTAAVFINSERRSLTEATLEIITTVLQWRGIGNCCITTSVCTEFNLHPNCPLFKSS